ncbi:MAG: TMF family protein, partial [Flavobacterium sp.]|nr:TMF family protein [Flavobacterium sp.]
LPPVIKLDRNDATNQAGLLSVGISGNGFASGLLAGGSAYFKLEDPYGNSANSDMGFSTNGLASQMVIKHSGNVGIGIELPVTKLDVQNGAVRIGNTCTPVGYKLFVEQGILTEKVKVAVNCSLAWADYVFANDYKLQPLTEVEKFINKNKHLPNVPSASELEKEGLDLGKMQAKQMEKIEELTLYLIEMKKEIEILKSENKSLKSKN